MGRIVRALLAFTMAVSMCGILCAQDDDGGGGDPGGGESYADAGSETAEDIADTPDTPDAPDAGDAPEEVTETRETYTEYPGPAAMSTHTVTAGTAYVSDRSPSAFEAAVAGAVVGAEMGAAAAGGAQKTGSVTRGAATPQKVGPARETTAAVVDAGNKLCPVTGEPVSGKDFYLYEGKRYGLCCPMCPATFASDPAKYSAIADREAAGK